MRDAALTALALALTLLGACSFDPPPLDDTMYSCRAETPRCPDGFTCIENVCRRDQLGVVDGGTDDRDAPAPDDGGTPDASPADASTLVTATFGERAGATHRGVTADTYLRSDQPTTSYGGDVTVIVDGSPETIALLRFDVSAIPAGSTVISASVTVNVHNRLLQGGLASAEALAEAWSQSSATWFRASSSASWSTEGAGGDAIGAAVFADQILDEARDFELTLPALVVQRWVNDAGDNHGLRWRSTTSDNLEFHSSESTVEDARPLLRVRYRPIGS